MFLLLTISTNALCQEESNKQIDNKSLEKQNRLMIFKALLAERKDLQKHIIAVTMFENMTKEYGHDYELLWTASRLFYYLAQRFKEDKKKSISYNQKGVKYGKMAFDINSKGYDGRYWWAMNYVLTAVDEGVITILKVSKQIKLFLEKMIKDEPNRFEAYMMLGGMYRSLPGFPIAWGDNDKSLELLKKAEKIASNNPELLIEIAETYVELDQEDEAKQYYLKASKAPAPEGMEFETEDAHNYARKRIKEIE